ncbi:ParB N-terminal domain-containing protein [Bradyrhizobium sp. Leo170]|uniref:ParB N-terminal domain-containing protein n=1 Tax=Bradyrhizobium sp. Leo170 TaxID=1571199 RepID=UPI0013EECA56|nr:ParB N-terminal domain-containing protein [Bradyrhizobium sp. Leo170]
MPDVLVVTNYGDQTFDSDRGSWNITRALRDCLAGKFESFQFDIEVVVAANQNIEIDENRIVALVAEPVKLAAMPPLIFVLEDGMTWLIDGQHRVRALQRLGHKRCVGFVIDDAAPYRISFNGERVAPWMRS